MIEILKALFVVFTMALAGFIYCRIAYANVIDGRLIDRWRNLFLAITVVAFLVPNYWLVLVAMSIIVIVMGANVQVKPATYLVVLFAAPAAGALVKGFAGIKNFLYLYPFNVMAIIILLPLLFAPRETKKYDRYGALADWCFIAFSLLSLALAFRDTTITDGFRRFTAYILTAFGPYLVFSRYNWTLDRLKIATLAYVIPLIALSCVAVAETALNWHFYQVALWNWDINFFVRYLQRGGLLRSYASVFGPISFGLFLVVAFALMPAVLKSAPKGAMPKIGYAILGVGLISTFSRGPWVGAALAVLAFVMTTGRPFGNLMRLGLVGAAAFPLIAVTPFGGKIIGMLPFIGEDQSSTIDYRQRLWETAFPYVVDKTPWFGSDDYYDAPELQSLVQGQGIIDIVNSYLQVALDKGLVGLALFIGVSFFAAWSCWRSIAKACAFDEELAAYAQGWFAALLGVMLTLVTTTNVVAQIAEVHWLLCGICVGIARSVAAAAEARALAPTGEGSGPPPPSEEPPRPAAGPAPSLPPHLRQYVKSAT